MEGDQIRGRPTPGGSARTRERMRQSLLHTEHVAPSRAASHSLLGMLAVQAGVHGQRDQSLPAPHAPTLALGERLLATGARASRSDPRVPRRGEKQTKFYCGKLPRDVPGPVFFKMCGVDSCIFDKRDQQKRPIHSAHLKKTGPGSLPQ